LGGMIEVGKTRMKFGDFEEVKEIGGEVFQIYENYVVWVWRTWWKKDGHKYYRSQLENLYIEIGTRKINYLEKMYTNPDVFPSPKNLVLYFKREGKWYKLDNLMYAKKLGSKTKVKGHRCLRVPIDCFTERGNPIDEDTDRVLERDSKVRNCVQEGRNKETKLEAFMKE